MVCSVACCCFAVIPQMNPVRDHSATLPMVILYPTLVFVATSDHTRRKKKRSQTILIQLMRYLPSLCPHKTSRSSTGETAPDCRYVIKLALKLNWVWMQRGNSFFSSPLGEQNEKGKTERCKQRGHKREKWQESNVKIPARVTETEGSRAARRTNA